ncbi:MAG: ABC transporter substrate-binding protein [Pseudomonadota bacterium]
MVRKTHPLPPRARRLAAQFRAGHLSRRGFMARATSLGIGAASAASLIGIEPLKAQEAPRPGGTLKLQMVLRPLTDPRAWDWTEMANFCRGWLEYLVEYESDGSFRGMLLESWEANEAGDVYTLFLRDGVTWSNGDAFTAAHVAFNLERWCARDADANSMAVRLATLIDDETGQLREGGIEIVDDFTLRLNLARPDITLIPSFADYPAAIVHPSYGGGDPRLDPIGTGPYLPDPDYRSGEFAALVRREGPWWGSAVFGKPALDRIEFYDLGTDPANHVAALQDGAVDLIDQSTGVFVEVLDTLDFPRSEVLTAATYVVRCRADADIGGTMPYADPRVRRALALAVENATALELGLAGLGDVAANHHVSPLHPDYADIGPARFAPAEARMLLAEAGFDGFPHELISVDDEWQGNTCDAVAAMLGDAGIPVRRRRLPGEVFWADWRAHPFSGTEWAMRPLGIQLLALAYRSDSAWNETGYANSDFDDTLDRALAIQDDGDRKAVMGELQAMLVEDGVIIQPYWRTLVRHTRVPLVGAEIRPTLEIRPYAMGFAEG